MDKKIGERLARVLAELDNRRWDDLKAEETGLFSSAPSQGLFKRRADQILIYLHAQGYRLVDPNQLPVLSDKRLAELNRRALPKYILDEPDRVKLWVTKVERASTQAQRADMLGRLGVSEAPTQEEKPE